LQTVVITYYYFSSSDTIPDYILPSAKKEIQEGLTVEDLASLVEISELCGSVALKYQLAVHLIDSKFLPHFSQSFSVFY
jgi:hypothetical protein